MRNSRWHLACPDGEVDLLEDRSGILALMAGSFAELNGGWRSFDHCVGIAVSPVDVSEHRHKSKRPRSQSQPGQAGGVAACTLDELWLGFEEHIVVLQAEEKLPGEVCLKLIGNLCLLIGQSLQEGRAVSSSHQGDEAVVSQCRLDIREFFVSRCSYHDEIRCSKEIVVAAIYLDTCVLPFISVRNIVHIGLYTATEAADLGHHGLGPGVGLP